MTDSRMTKIADSVLELLGRTPVVRLTRLPKPGSAAVVAQELDFGGPAFTVDAACASALVAVHDAVTYLRAGHVDAALAGGVYLNLTPDHLIGFSRIGAISSKGICRPFDVEADGFVQGEGVGLVMLKRLRDAQHDGDRVYAVLTGSSLNNDGKGDGPMSPRGEGQEAVIEAAWEDARIGAGDVEYCETHGTGTIVGDRTELGALKNRLAGRDGPVWIGSAKANVGHTMSAAGIAGLQKAALAVYRRTFPPLANWTAPHPDIASSPETFAVPTAALPWTSARRVATVSSFGFGVTNGHVVLEAAPEAAPTRVYRLGGFPPPNLGNAQLVVLSADDGKHLAAYATDLADTLDDPATFGAAGDDLAAANRALDDLPPPLRQRLTDADEEICALAGEAGTLEDVGRATVRISAILARVLDEVGGDFHAALGLLALHALARRAGEVGGAAGRRFS
jgi:acyl transferase domain-containing protein